MYTNLLVATDGSKLSEKAVAHAIGLAKRLGVRVTAFYAAPDYPEPGYGDGIIHNPLSREEYAAMVAREAEQILGKVGNRLIAC